MAGTISLSKPMQQFVAEQTAARGLKDDKAYFKQLLKEEQVRVGRQRLLELLDEGRASGYHEVTEETWQELKEKVKERFAARRKAKAK
ncbi:MAG: hypothetical protein JNJ77_13190 [Planctomycetia bacterium]|nr:hypothetical protein [Planctomycetia bacterium]